MRFSFKVKTLRIVSKAGLCIRGTTRVQFSDDLWTKQKGEIYVNIHHESTSFVFIKLSAFISSLPNVARIGEL